MSINLTHDFNTYVSRKDGDGMIYKLSSPMWLVLFVYLLVLVNAIGWGIYGIASLVGLVI